MRTQTFKQRLLAGDPLVGTFVKTPSHILIEILAKSELDFLCLDGEHAPFDRTTTDSCIAVARALDMPILVRVGIGTSDAILQALDCGAVGVVVPHVNGAAMAEKIVRDAKFGTGGRGFASSTRWAGYATRTMQDVLDQSDQETVVIAQIEEPEVVPLAGEIAAVDGIDALFVGPADLSIAMGKTDLDSDELRAALAQVGQAAQQAGKAMISFVPETKRALDWRQYGITTFFVGSEHAWILQGANRVAAELHDDD